MIWQTTLELDFGQVGWRHGEPFRITLDAAPLTELIAHARQAHRVYELNLITRPGDVWDYLTVILHELPECVSRRAANARSAASPRFGGEHPWPQGRMPFPAFDALFYWAWDDTDPADEAWLRERESRSLHAFAEQLLAMARSSQQQCEPWCREIHMHELARIRAGTHPRHYQKRSMPMCEPHALKPGGEKYTEAFYAKLEELLRDPQLASVACRSGEDYRILTQLANEQRRRTRLTGHLPAQCLSVSALADFGIDNKAWETSVRLYQEGLPHGDLLIGHCRDILEGNWRVPRRSALTKFDQGPLKGFDRETGDGWVLYRAQAPVTRREALLATHIGNGDETAPVLCFGEQGPALLSFEHARFVLGEAVSPEVRELLATILAEWEQHGGTPQVFAQGDVSAFLRAGCQRVFAIPPDALQLTTLDELLGLHRRWTDALFALDCPTWMNSLLARHHSSGDPWKTWVVRTGNSEELPGDLILPAETLAARLGEAWQIAKQYRPG